MPLVDLFFATLWWFLFILWIIIVFRVFADIFRSHDLGGVAKTLWIIFVIFLPFLGVFVYIISRGHKMNEHAIEDAKAQDDAMRNYVQSVSGSSTSVADELTKLTQLRDAGTISGEDFDAAKTKLLA